MEVCTTGVVVVTTEGVVVGMVDGEVVELVELVVDVDDDELEADWQSNPTL